ncbi:Hpt domain-containing protein [Thalassotalea agarivorans]|nr:Hpt domain-containing protein [Thalassotalea agarivorans]
MEKLHLDEALLEGYLSRLGKDTVVKMLDLYLNQVEQYLSDITKAATSSDNSDWTNACHKMKGAAGSVGLLKVYQLSADCEKSALSATQKAQLVEKMAEENNQAIAFFKQWLESV